MEGLALEDRVQCSRSFISSAQHTLDVADMQDVPSKPFSGAQPQQLPDDTKCSTNAADAGNFELSKEQ